MKKLVLLLSILLICDCAANKVQQVSSSEFEGIWEGLATGLVNSTISWTVKITIKGDYYFIDLPSLGCGGQLTLLSSSPDKLVFSYKYSYGKMNCVEAGPIEIVKVGINSAMYEVYLKTGEKGAIGNLTRKSTTH